MAVMFPGDEALVIQAVGEPGGFQDARGVLDDAVLDVLDAVLDVLDGVLPVEDPLGPLFGVVLLPFQLGKARVPGAEALLRDQRGIGQVQGVDAGPVQAVACGLRESTTMRWVRESLVATYQRYRKGSVARRLSGTFIVSRAKTRGVVSASWTVTPKKSNSSSDRFFSTVSFFTGTAFFPVSSGTVSRRSVSRRTSRRSRTRVSGRTVRADSTPTVPRTVSPAMTAGTSISDHRFFINLQI